jgi:hypothetical protein
LWPALRARKQQRDIRPCSMEGEVAVTVSRISLERPG